MKKIHHQDMLKLICLGLFFIFLESGTPSGAGKETDDEVDGKSMSEDDDEDVDGVPLDGAALLKSAQQKSELKNIHPHTFLTEQILYPTRKIVLSEHI